MNLDPKDKLRRQWYDANPAERLSLIADIATRCYKEWDTWDIGPGPYGVQMAYLFATIAGAAREVGGNWCFELEMLEDEADLLTVPLAKALLVIFPLEHAIWLYIERQWNGLPESLCPVCAHDCEGAYPYRQCYECDFCEETNDPKTYSP